MEFNDEKQLVIDLDKDGYDPVMLLQHQDVRSLRLNNMSKQITLPVELVDFPELKHIYITGKDDGVLYEPPENLEKLINIEKLTLWSFCDLEKLSPMPHIKAFDVVVKDPFEDTRTIFSVMPHLQKMEIWGSHLKKGHLPAEIGNFSNLVYLELVSCGLKELPAEFAQLQSLRRLFFRGLPMKSFPEVISQLTWLEELHFQQPIVSLPDSFANLKSLRILNFVEAFNDGTMTPVNKWENKKVYLHPIPDAIGKLPALEELDLSMCGVVNLDFLQGATQLKKFRSRYNGLENCDGFSGFKNLAELDLESSEVLQDLSGLKGLPVEKLRIRDCDEITSLEPILSLPNLLSLDISGCDELEDLEPVYQHPTLKELKASSELLEAWQKREIFQSLSPMEQVRKDLESDAIETFESAIGALKLYVDKNYHDQTNPLAGFFDQEADNYEIVHLEGLEEGMKKHRTQLSGETLLQLVDLSFRNAAEDNYQITVMAIEEIIRRKDARAQKGVVEIFLNACDYYDFGHRYWESTVLDQLYDRLFPDFETEAIISLLQNGHDDMMNRNGGDGADQCFVPAFNKAKNDEELETITKIFFLYQSENIEYHGAAYFETFQNQIREVLRGKHLEIFESYLEKSKEEMEFHRLLQSEEPADAIQLIHMLDTLEEERFRSTAHDIIRSVLSCADLPEPDWRKTLDFYMAKNRCLYDVTELVQKYLYPSGVGAIVSFFKSRNESEKEFVIEVCEKILETLNLEGVPLEETMPLREYLAEVQNQTIVDVYNMELIDLYRNIKGIHNEKNESRPGLLQRFQEVSTRAKGPLDLEGRRRIDLAFDFYLLASSSAWGTLKRICRGLYPLIKQSHIIRSIQYPIMAAIKTDDRDFFHWLLTLLPKDETDLLFETEDQLLVYNIACAYAHFREKESMLNYIKKSMELGKTKEQFMDDEDFAFYRDDGEFLQTLESTD